MILTMFLFLFQAVERTPHMSGTPYPDTFTPEWSWFTIIGATIFALIIGCAFGWALTRKKNINV